MLIIHYYTDARTGKRIGSVNKHKIDQMAKQSHSQKIDKCGIDEFNSFKNGELHNSEWID